MSPRSQLAAITAVMSLSLAACTTAAPPPGRGSPSASTPTSSPPSTGGAADRLRHLADALRPLPSDAKDPADYPHTVLRIQHWNRATNAVARSDETWWRAVNGSGEARVRRLPERRDLILMPSREEHSALAAAPASTDRYPEPGRLAMVFTEPIPADQATLTTELFRHQPAETGPQALLWAVCDLAGHHYLNQHVRASTLRILADIEGLTFTGVADDIAGRTGWWFRLDTPSNRDLISLDPSTGRLLVCSQNLATTPTALFSYALHLDADRSAGPGQDPAPVHALAEGPAPVRAGRSAQ